jgi:hypothetical protein
MDKKSIIAELVKKHGVRLDEDDPAFLIADIVVFVLESERKTFAEETAKLLDQFESSMDMMTEKASVQYAARIGAAVKTNVEGQILPPLRDAQKAVTKAANALAGVKYWLFGCMVFGALLTALLVKITS